MLDDRPTPPAPDAILVQGAREHNLKNISVSIPRGEFVVVTGVSGSGKSTLAFDILFAEGQRRFLDAMNAYARQYVDQLARPDVDLVSGIPPTVSIEQRNSRGGGKSTVATVTEIHHFLRLLFARVGIQFCPECRIPVEPQERDQLARRLVTEARQRGDLTLLAPLIRNRKGFHSDLAAWALRQGFDQLRADGHLVSARDPLRLDRYREHSVEVVTGVVPARRPPSILELIDRTIEIGKGTLLALDPSGHTSVHSTQRACHSCGRSFDALDPKHFSYNSPAGWCPKCRGFGELFYLPDVDRGARADAIEESWFDWQEGEREPCPDCAGMRLNPVARAVRIPAHPKPAGNPSDWLDLDTLARAPVHQAHDLFTRLKLPPHAAAIARDILPEIRERLRFLDQVGLGYLQLGRAVPTLSGGEAQRIRLAAQLGSNLSGVLYVLDEPTIGLHARDNDQLLDTLDALRRRGNSLLVVEHDEATMRRASHVIDLGPGAGLRGGQVVAQGTLRQLLRHPESVTGQCLRHHPTYPSRGSRRPLPKNHPHLTLAHARLHNLKNLTVDFPLGRLVVVTGISGSGKSTLLRDCLLPALHEVLNTRKTSARSSSSKSATPDRGLVTSGADSILNVHEVDQSPIGRTPRSIPATYVGFFDDIRQLFAQIPEARLRGYNAGRFSFNSAQGRCTSCEGAGVVKLEMNFLPPAFNRCETCNGLRFNPETLDVLLNQRNIAQVLELSVEEAILFFQAFPRIRRPLEALRDTGLGYLKLGQTSPTLSGGEAQRVKLVTHLLSGLKYSTAPQDPRHRHNLFLLEEPTIGLHIADVRLLLDVLQRLVDAGHTVLVIEHNLDVIAEADWVIDLGPEGGDHGGHLVAQGTPEAIARHRTSHTGHYLSKLLNPTKRS